MATRATYLFRIDGHPDLYYYIHHDGYPDGAAVYLRRMILGRQWEPQIESMAAAFARTNAGASLTPSHEAHGDTEWRYTVTGEATGYRLTVHERIDFSDRWRVFFDGGITEFLTLHGDPESTPLTRHD